MSCPQKMKANKTITRTQGPKETGILSQKSAILNCRTFEWNHSFPLIRAFLFICMETLGSRRLSINSRIIICLGRLLLPHLDSKQIQNGWQCLFSWKKPASRRKADSPCSFCKGRRCQAPHVVDIGCWVGGWLGC